MIDTSGLVHPEQVRQALEQAIRRSFVAASTIRNREPHHLGLSALARCTRQAAYKLAGTEPSDVVLPDEGRPANLGTWQHEGILPHLVDEISGARKEVEISLRVAGQRLRGHADLLAPEIVFDLKTVMPYRLQLIRHQGPMPSHVLQLATYGVGLLQAGHSVRWLVLAYLDRASGDLEVVTLRFTNRLALQVIDRIFDLSRHAQSPDEAPRADADGNSMYGPGFGYSCNECPWLRRCWGPDAQPGQRQPRQYERPEVEALLHAYAEQRAARAEADQHMEEILALLEHTPHGVYGAIRYGRNRDSKTNDPKAAYHLLEELGIEIPQTWRTGAVSIRYVKRAEPKPADPS